MNFAIENTTSYYYLCQQVVVAGGYQTEWVDLKKDASMGSLIPYIGNIKKKDPNAILRI
jgi:DUF1009 family protein